MQGTKNNILRRLFQALRALPELHAHEMARRKGKGESARAETFESFWMNLLESFWVWFLLASAAGFIMGMLVCAICAGWFDDIEKKNKKSR